jgi:hypothetical protein
MGDANLKVFFVNPCLNFNEKLVQLPLFLFSLSLHKLRRQNNSFTKKSNLRKFKRAIHGFCLYVSKKMKRLGIPKVEGRGFLISLGKGDDPMRNFYTNFELNIFTQPNISRTCYLSIEHNGEEVWKIYKNSKNPRFISYKKKFLKTNIQTKFSPSKLKTQSIRIHCKILCFLETI